MNEQQKQSQGVATTIDTTRSALPHISINIERVELKRGVPLEDRNLNAQFKHYCSESYAQAISSSSCISRSSFFREDSVESIMVKNPLCRTRSKSAPASPKGGLHKSLPSGTFANIKDSSLTAATKKKKSASISNFFRKISPRLRRNAKDSKPWIVVEFSQCDIEGPVDKDSVGSDISFEMALKNKDFSSNALPTSAQDSKSDDSLMKATKSNKSYKHSLSKVSSRLHQGIFKTNKKSQHTQGVEDKEKKAIASDCSGHADSLTKKTVHQGIIQGPPDAVITVDVTTPSPKAHQPPRSLYLRDRLQQSPTARVVSQNMASMESIGNCSLDVDASYNGSANLKVMDTSENTLRSVSMDDLDETRRAAATNANQRTERSSSGHALKITNGPDDLADLPDDIINNSKKPSYLNISCSISGYSDYSHYHHSRPANSAKYLSRSRDSSPMPSSKMLTTVNFNVGTFKEKTRYEVNKHDESDFINKRNSSETKEFISHQERFTESNEKKYFLSHHEFSVVNELKNATRSKSSFVENFRKETSYEFDDANSDAHSESKSIVKQRIERLNAQKCGGERSQPEASSNGHSSISRGSPPVFRHLRKEFRDQLSLAPKSLKKEFAKSSQNDHPPSTTIAHPSLNGHSNKNASAEVEKPAPPRKPEGLLPMSSKLLLEMSSKSESEVPKEKKRDGHYFLNVMENEKQKINDLLVQPQQDLHDDSIPEEAKGKLRSAIGKANLLTSKKFSQFRQLCEKNINQNLDEEFSTNSSDLEGFWDMVMLQVVDIHDTFKHIEKMRRNSWKEDTSSKTNGVTKGKRGAQFVRGQSKSAPTTPERSAKAANAAKAREEARKRLIAAKKKARQSNVQNSQNVEIYAP